MFGRLLALFLIVPVVELALLIQLGGLIGFWPTIGIIILTGITGTYLAKREGLSVWRAFNDRLRQGQLPGRELLDGVIILVAGALLITPGVLSDIAGLIGLVPVTRSVLRRYLNARIQKASQEGSVFFSFGGSTSFGGAGADFGEPAATPLAEDESEWRGQPRDRPEYRG